MQEERCQFLQFTTGCACLPSAATGQWEFRIQKGSDGQYMHLASALAAICSTLVLYCLVQLCIIPGICYVATIMVSSVLWGSAFVNPAM